ncbi:hypothetical protein HWI79_2784 [Cryptosporidium felis]|nr:hypothetical protein HWI79_2784 [Cryptosporidium felis]
MEVENTSQNQFTTGKTELTTNGQTKKRPSDATNEEQSKKACSGMTDTTAMLVGTNQSYITAKISTCSKTVCTTFPGSTTPTTTTTTTKSGPTTGPTAGTNVGTDGTMTTTTTGSTDTTTNGTTNITITSTTSDTTYETNTDTKSSTSTKTQCNRETMNTSKIETEFTVGNGIKIQKGETRTTETSTGDNTKQVKTTTNVLETKTTPYINTLVITETSPVYFFDTMENTITFIDQIPTKTETTTTVIETYCGDNLVSKSTETQISKEKITTQGDAQTQETKQDSTTKQTQDQAQKQLQSQMQNFRMQLQGGNGTQGTIFGVNDDPIQFGKTEIKLTETYQQDNGSYTLKKEQKNADGTSIVTTVYTSSTDSDFPTTCADSKTTGVVTTSRGNVTKQIYAMDGKQTSQTEGSFEQTVKKDLETGEITTKTVTKCTGDKDEIISKTETIKTKTDGTTTMSVELVFTDQSQMTTTATTTTTAGSTTTTYDSTTTTTTTAAPASTTGTPTVATTTTATTPTTTTQTTTNTTNPTTGSATTTMTNPETTTTTGEATVSQTAETGLPNYLLKAMSILNTPGTVTGDNTKATKLTITTSNKDSEVTYKREYTTEATSNFTTRKNGDSQDGALTTMQKSQIGKASTRSTNSNAYSTDTTKTKVQDQTTKCAQVQDQNVSEN